MAERVWLHKREGDEWGWSAWSLDELGFATWAPTRDEVLQRVPGKLAEYRAWLIGHGETVASGTNEPNAVDGRGSGAGGVVVVQEIAGNEVAFRDDLVPATVAEIQRCARLLDYTRRDLLEAVQSLPDAVLDWDPPGEDSSTGVWWRTIRQILLHIALTEVGYYLPSVGWRAGLNPETLKSASWQQALELSRRETRRFLDELTMPGSDRARIIVDDETWSVRKVLRRLVWHERLHYKGILRIAREYNRLHRGDAAVRDED